MIFLVASCSLFSIYHDKIIFGPFQFFLEYGKSDLYYSHPKVGFLSFGVNWVLFSFYFNAKKRPKVMVFGLSTHMFDQSTPRDERLVRGGLGDIGVFFVWPRKLLGLSGRRSGWGVVRTERNCSIDRYSPAERIVRSGASPDRTFGCYRCPSFFLIIINTPSVSKLRTLKVLYFETEGVVSFLLKTKQVYFQVICKLEHL